jgi:hypothetical protein
MRERSKDEKAALAARLLSVWEKKPRKQVVVTEQDHDLLLSPLQPLRVVVDREKQEIVFVVHCKEKATNYLRKEYNLYHVRDMLCRNTT